MPGERQESTDRRLSRGRRNSSGLTGNDPGFGFLLPYSFFVGEGVIFFSRFEGCLPSKKYNSNHLL